MNDVTVILNCFRRPYTLEAQYKAVMNQSVKPKEVMIWYNCPSEDKFEFHNPEILSKCSTVMSMKNHGVWARFSYALMAKTEYILILDDDTICGSRWIENCIDTIKEYNGLLCTIGIVFNSKEKYIGNCYRVGWDRPNETTTKVDFGGHAWFFRRDWLAAYWSELPNLDVTPYCGEDMHFSYILQKKLGLNTYIPPHPINDKSLWGSLPETALHYGGDDKSIWGNNMGNVGKVIEESFQNYLAKGWEIING